MTTCHICGIPVDAGIFDRSSIVGIPPNDGEEVVLAQFSLHRNYCGHLLYFAQFTEPARIRTPGLVWEIRIDGRPREPYLGLDHVVNPWGLNGFPLNIRLDEGATVELAVRRASVAHLPPRDRERVAVTHVGGRLVGRYWYNIDFGGAPNPL
jgi:hypothetical protein